VGQLSLLESRCCLYCMVVLAGTEVLCNMDLVLIVGSVSVATVLFFDFIGMCKM